MVSVREVVRRIPVGRRRPRRGFTLLEAILALTLIITIMSGVFGFYLNTLSARDAGGMIARDAMIANFVLQRMAQEIREASDVVPADGQAFNGTYNKLTIMRVKMPDMGAAYAKQDSLSEDPAPGQMDLQRITYEVPVLTDQRDAAGQPVNVGLLRTEENQFRMGNPKIMIKDDEAEQEDAGQAESPPQEADLTAPEIKFLRFRYFDGAEWQNTWKNKVEVQDPAQTGAAGTEDAGNTGGSLPQAVEITIGTVRDLDYEELGLSQLSQMDERQKNERHPDRFTIRVYLPQTDQSHLSSRKFGSKNKEDLQMGGEQ